MSSSHLLFLIVILSIIGVSVADIVNAVESETLVVVVQFISPDFVQIKICHFIDDCRFKTLIVKASPC